MPHERPRPARILVVDDSRAIQMIVKRAVGRCGYPHVEIELASDGAAALGRIEHFVPDLVITDWHMPNMSGLEMLKTLRATRATAPKVGVVSTESSPRIVSEAMAWGARFWVNKPFTEEVLVQRIVEELPVSAFVAAPAPAESTPVPVATEAEPVPVEGPVKSQAMASVLGVALRGIDFRLVSTAPVASGELTPSLLVGLYATGPGRKVVGLGVMDSVAVSIVGGRAQGMDLDPIRASLGLEVPAEATRAAGAEFLGRIAILMQVGQGAGGLQLSQVSQVRRDFRNLVEVLSRKLRRSDFILELPGVGSGRMVFIALEQNRAT